MLVPIFRDYELFPNTVNNPIVGRWHCGTTIVGDASAGVVSATFLFQDVRGMFGQHSMFDLQYLNVDLGNVSTLQIVIILKAYERTTGVFPPTYQGWARQSTITAQYYLSLGITERPNYIWRFSDYPGFATYLNINASVNTNGMDYIFAAGGYIYDERKL